MSPRPRDGGQRVRLARDTQGLRDQGRDVGAAHRPPRHPAARSARGRREATRPAEAGRVPRGWNPSQNRQRGSKQSGGYGASHEVPGPGGGAKAARRGQSPAPRARPVGSAEPRSPSVSRATDAVANNRPYSLAANTAHVAPPAPSGGPVRRGRQRRRGPRTSRQRAGRAGCGAGGVRRRGGGGRVGPGGGGRVRWQEKQPLEVR